MATVQNMTNGQNAMTWKERDFVAAEQQYIRETTAMQMVFVPGQGINGDLISTLDSGKKVIYQMGGMGCTRFVT